MSLGHQLSRNLSKQVRIEFLMEHVIGKQWISLQALAVVANMPRREVAMNLRPYLRLKVLERRLVHVRVPHSSISEYRKEETEQ